MNPAAILHVTSLFGGGVDRHLRDIVAGVDRPHLVWHAGDGADVLEDPARGRFWTLSADATTARGDVLAGWLAGRGVGLVHLHQLTRAPRERGRWVCDRLGVPQVATLHDILFLHPDAFAAADPLAADGPWLDETSRTLRACAAVFAPSRWLADLAVARVPGLAVEVVPNGSRAVSGTLPETARPEFAMHRPARVVALLGALGPHKGSGLADEVAMALAGTDIGLVVIGYLDTQLVPGWRVPGRLFIHGAYEEGHAPGLLRAYGAELVLMPNTVPESFSYALSDAWAAGLPVLASPAGALAERIDGVGGGWLLPEQFDGPVVAQHIRELFDGARSTERQRLQSELAHPDPARVPPLEIMTRSLTAFYERFGIDPDGPASAGDAAIESLVARNLDGSLFRHELVRLADELAQTLAALKATEERAHAFEEEAKEWIAKLESDIRAVQDDLQQILAQRDQLAQEVDRLTQEFQCTLPELDLLRLNREAMDRLPSPLRRLLLKLAFNARR